MGTSKTKIPFCSVTSFQTWYQKEERFPLGSQLRTASRGGWKQALFSLFIRSSILLLLTSSRTKKNWCLFTNFIMHKHNEIQGNENTKKKTSEQHVSSDCLIINLWRYWQQPNYWNKLLNEHQKRLRCFSE